MDPLVWLVLAGIVFVLLAVASFITLRRGTSKSGKESEGGEVVVDGGGGDQQRQPYLQQRARNLRARAAALRRARAEMGAEPGAEDVEEPEGLDETEEMALPFKKIGTKKLRKMKEKAERKVMREQEEASREDRKKREALREEERKQAEAEKNEQRKKEEEEKERLQLEKEREEYEEYLKLKEGFTVEEEGEQVDEEEEARGVQDFIDYIKKEKVVYLENLASEFNLKTQDAIDRVQKLKESGDLTGIIDDRGKFIFISEEELKAVATFIRQRGRVSISELASASNSLINLQPESSSTVA